MSRSGEIALSNEPPNQLEIIQIEDEDDLYKRLPKGFVGPNKEVRSVAYKVNGIPDNEVSVDLAKLTSPEDSVRRDRGRGFGLGTLKASYPRSLNFNVIHRPLTENYSHSQIEGNNSKALCRLLAENTTVIIEPEP